MVRRLMVLCAMALCTCGDVLAGGAIVNPYYDTGLTMDGYEITGLQNSGTGWKFDAKTGRLTLSKNMTYTIGGDDEASLLPVQIVVNSSCRIRFEDNTFIRNLKNDKPLISITKASADVEIVLSGTCYMDTSDTMIESTADGVALAITGGDGRLARASVGGSDIKLKGNAKLVVGKDGSGPTIEGIRDIGVRDISVCGGTLEIAGPERGEIALAGCWDVNVRDGNLRFLKRLKCVLSTSLSVYGGLLVLDDGLDNAGEVYVGGGRLLSHGRIRGAEWDCALAVKVAGGLLEVDANESAAGATNYQNCDVYAKKLTVTGGRVEITSLSTGCMDIYGGVTRLRELYNTPRCGNDIWVGGGSLEVERSNIARSFDIRRNGEELYYVWIYGLAESSSSGKKVTFSEKNFDYDVANFYTDLHGDACIWLPAREAPYRFVANGYTYSAMVHGHDANAIKGNLNAFVVTYAANGGRFENGPPGDRFIDESLPAGSNVTAPFPVDLKLSRPGFQFECWDLEGARSGSVDPGFGVGKLDGNIVFRAHWREITAGDVNAGEPVEEGAAPVDSEQTQEKVVRMAFSPLPLERDECQPDTVQFQDYVAGTRFGTFPTVSRPGYRFDGWGYGDHGVEKVTEDSIVPLSNRTLWARWIKLPPTERVVTFWSAVGNDPVNQCIEGRTCTIGGPVGDLPQPPVYNRHRFVRWFDCYGAKATVGADTVVATGYTDFSVQAEWANDWVDWMRDRYSCEKLSELVDDCPAEIGSAKGVGLAAGLKVVQDKSTKEWYLEGVPTELVDYETREMYVEITPRGGAKANYLLKVRIGVDASEIARTRPVSIQDGGGYTRLRPAYVGDVYGQTEYAWDPKSCSDPVRLPAEDLHDYVMASELWPEATKDWKFSGLPKGFGFATKDGTKWTDVNKVAHVAPAGAIYGSSLEPLAAVVSASRTVKGVGGTYTEVYKALLEVYPRTAEGEFRYGGYLMGEVGEKSLFVTMWDWLPDNARAKATDLPSGLSLTTTELTVPGYDGPVPAGTVYGTFARAETHVAKISDGVNTEWVLVQVSEKRPSVVVNYGAAISAMRRSSILSPGSSAKAAGETPVLMQGVACRYRISCAKDAKVKVDGKLPDGLKLVQNKDKKSVDYGTWTIEGTPSKPGDYVVVFVVTVNGVSTSISERYTVEPNRYAGEYRGTIVSSPAAGAAPRAGTILVGIAAAGTAKVTVSEDGKSTMTYSTKSIGYSEVSDYAYLDFELKPTSADKKLGYGVRTGRVTISIPNASAGEPLANYRPLEGVVRLEDGTKCGDARGYMSQTLVYRSNARTCRSFVWSDGSCDFPIATIRTELKEAGSGKATTANVTGSLYDGTAIKLTKIPYVFNAGDCDEGNYFVDCFELAPFAVKAKDGRVYVFHGFRTSSINPERLAGKVTFVDDEGGVRTVDQATFDVTDDLGKSMSINMLLSNQFLDEVEVGAYEMFFDFGYDGFELFPCVVGKDRPSARIYAEMDALENLIQSNDFVLDIPNKQAIGADGAISFKFTSKDKSCTYQVSLVTVQTTRFSEGSHSVYPSGSLSGTVVKTWKEGKTTRTLYGTVDFLGYHTLSEE